MKKCSTYINYINPQKIGSANEISGNNSSPTHNNNQILSSNGNESLRYSKTLSVPRISTIIKNLPNIVTPDVKMGH